MHHENLAKANGLEFSYHSEGHGPTLVLLHAFPLNKAMWEGQVEALKDVCHVLTMDMRGFGRSQVTDGVFTLDDLADDLHHLLQRLGHTQIVLGGLSMGGYVALAYMRRHPAGVRGLILADTKATADGPEALAKREAMIEEVAARGTRGVARAFPRAVVSASTAETQSALLDRLKVWIEDTVPSTVIGAQRAMAARPDSSALLPTIKVPTLILVGEEDPTTPPADAEAMAAAIHDARLVRLPGAGHLANLEAPDAFNAAVRDFMAQYRD